MIISIHNLQKRFGEVVACNIEQYTINNGEMVGLVGNNGAGKTTLFRLILDLLKADTGNVTLTSLNHNMHDIDVAASEEWKHATGAFIDESFLIDYLTPDEYFQFLGRIYGIPKDEVTQRIEHFRTFFAGEVIGEKKLIRDYSMGNKQKIGIACAMLNRPDLLILDEPFNFLDPSSQAVIKHLLKKYHEDTNATVLISSHNLNHTVEVCPRIALLEHGVIIRDIDNVNGSAEAELESYFDIAVTPSDQTTGPAPATEHNEATEPNEVTETAEVTELTEVNESPEITVSNGSPSGLPSAE